MSAFFYALTAGKDRAMRKDKKDQALDEVIIVRDETGVQLYLSEQAANRLSWVITGIFALITLPAFILAIISL